MAGMVDMPGMSSGGHASTGTTAAPADSRSVSSLTVGTDRPADVTVTLIARRESFTLAGGRVVDGYTLNGTSPGPKIRAVQGQLVQVRLVNESVPDGITLHWHGVDVPNRDDGVAGVTQDAVPVAEPSATDLSSIGRHLLVPLASGIPRAGDRWPAGGADRPPPGATRIHSRRRPGRTGPSVRRQAHHQWFRRRPCRRAVPGDRVKVRVINTDNGPMSVLGVRCAYRLIAVDGRDVNGPGLVEDRSVTVTAGGRVDLEVVLPLTARRCGWSSADPTRCWGERTDQQSPPAGQPTERWTC